MKDIYNEISRLNVVFSCGTGGIVDLSSLDLRNVDLELYDFTDKHMANAILNPFKLDDTDFTNANMFQVNFVSSKTKHHNLRLFTKNNACSNKH